MFEADDSELSDKDKEQVKKLGLIWKQTGYGPKEKGSGVTHKKVDGKLVPVDKEKGDKEVPDSQKISGAEFERPGNGKATKQDVDFDMYAQDTWDRHGDEEPSGGSTDTKEFYKDKHWQEVPSPEETHEMTKDMSDEELDDLIANQEKELKKAQDQEAEEWQMFGGPPQGGGPSRADYSKAEKERLAGLQAEKDRRATGKEVEKDPYADRPDIHTKREKPDTKEDIQRKIDQLKKEYDSVMQSAREAGAEGDGYTQGEMVKVAEEIQSDIRKLKEKLSSMGRTGTEVESIHSFAEMFKRIGRR